MIRRDDIIKAHLFLRKNEHTIPDETLEFIKDAALRQWTLAYNSGDAACVCEIPEALVALDGWCPVHGKFPE